MLAQKVMAGLNSQGMKIIGSGSWVVCMRPLEEYIQRKIQRAIKQEREVCAQIADEWATREQKQFGNGGPGAAIRARGNE